jgi:Flp pilus assembly protein TadG
MKPRTKGQSLVEFAMVLPVLLSVIMGIVDFSYYVYNWSAIQFAVRKGAEQASMLPPREVRNTYSSAYVNTDPCYRVIIDELRETGSFNTATTFQETEVEIAFYVPTSSGGVYDPSTRFVKAADRTNQNVQPDRKVLNIIEVAIRNHRVTPLTPLGGTIFGSQMSFSASSRRTIMNTDIQGGMADNPDLLTCRDTP